MTAIPNVIAIHIAPASRLPMKAIEHAVVHTGGGIAGDRYEHARHRHVTVQSAEQLAQAAAILGQAIEPHMTRRNITVSTGCIPARPGDLFRIGTVELEVVRVAAPCKLLDDVIGIGARTALRRKAGSVCRVLVGGSIAIGDTVDLGG
jgi:MOSC domain-containing protein YiiM